MSIVRRMLQAPLTITITLWRHYGKVISVRRKLQAPLPPQQEQQYVRSSSVVPVSLTTSTSSIRNSRVIRPRRIAIIGYCPLFASYFNNHDDNNDHDDDDNDDNDDDDYNDKYDKELSSSSSDKIMLRWPKSMLAMFVASIVMHTQGLFALMKFDGSLSTMTGALIGVGLEGIFLFISTSVLLSQKHLFMRALALLYYVSAVVFLLLDYQFQQKTGGLRMDMWVIADGRNRWKSTLIGEVADNAGQVICNIVGAFFTASLAGLFVFWVVSREQKSSVPSGTTKPKTTKDLFVIFVGMIGAYVAGAWMPLFHTYASTAGSLILSPPGWLPQIDETLKLDHITEADTKSPNVILVIHESLSGELMMAKESSVKATPFLQQMFRSEDEYFVFENARGVSGDTVDAMSGIHSGCTPLDHTEGRKFALNNTIGAEFKRKGYNTASFSSCEINFEGTKWWMMSDMLGGVNFDQVHHPHTTKDPLVNGPAQDDIAMEKHFQKWLEENKKRQGDTRQPFYAQFYYFNGHYPFFNNQNISGTTDTVDGVLSTVDKSIENIVRQLREAGELDNTIIIGTGDHGENLPARGIYKRLKEWDEDILHPMMYMYVPREISKKSPGIYENLRYNTRQLVSILDIFPTILHFLDGIPKENYPVTNEHCVRGFDLLKNKIPFNRVAWSFPGVNDDLSKTKRGILALHSGTSSSLMNRFGWPRRNFMSIVEYATIIHPKRNNESKVHLRDFNDWNSIIENMTGTSDEEVLKKSSHCITSFLKNLAKLSV